MKRLASATVVLAVAAVVGACGGSDDKKAGATKKDSKDCPRNAAANASYASRFEGTVSMDKSKHVLRVTRDGKPVAGAQVCINTAMVGMTSMHYTAEGREVAPGRYEVPVKFEMNGVYRGNVTATESGDEVSIPVSVKVAEHDMGDASKSSDDKSMDSSDDKSMESSEMDGMKSDDGE